MAFSFHNLVFPEPSRPLPGKRYFSLVLRSLHLLGIAGFSGLFIFDLPEAQWSNWAHLAIVTGLLMVMMEIWCDGVWFVQARGQIIIVKMILLVLCVYVPSISFACFVAMILLSGFFSHAPGKIRYYSIWHRRVVKALRAPDGHIRDSGQF